MRLPTGVGLETFAFGIVPKLECVVEGGSQDVLAVGRELDERNRRVVVVN